MTFFPLTDQAIDEVLGLLARRERFVFLETTRGGPDDHRSLLFLDPVERLSCTAADSPADFFGRAEHYLGAGYHLAGWFAYEFGYLLEPAHGKKARPDPGETLAVLGVFPPPFIYDHRSASFTGAGRWPAASPLPDAPFAIDGLRLNVRKNDYLKNIDRIKAYIESGDTYQVNYTLKLLFDLSGSPEALYKTLRRSQSVSFGAYCRLGSERILSFSPELFFRKQGNRCKVRPMKGTVRRGHTAAEDERLAAFLKNDPKNRSENVMIVDLLRNDLGRLSTMGTVRAASLFDLETYETLHQMTSTVTGELRDGISLVDMFRALFPCGSVTGAPKIRTMEIIRELEEGRRGVYTGAIGFITPAGDATFNVPIRTLTLANGKGAMGIGSGIVYDSAPEREWEECRLKGRFLTDPPQPFKLIETLLWKPGEGYWLLDLHLQRLARSARFFRYPADRDRLRQRLARESETFSGRSAMRVRLLLAKDGTVSVSATECPTPAPVLIPAPADSAALPRVRFSGEATSSLSPLVYHKTTLRDLYDREYRQAVAEGYVDVLFVNEKNEVTEGSITNVFIRKGDVFYTPPVSCGLLGGVFRAHFLSHCPAPVREKILTRAEVREADAIYIGNSVRGLVQVRLG